MTDDFTTLWSPAKVFSPTAAKVASLTQKDWTYIDTFLVTRFAPNPVPKFERNADTLRALLSLAAATERADEERDLERRVKTKALAALRIRDQEGSDSARGGEPLLIAVEESLTGVGRRCLGAVALLGVAIGCNSVDPVRLSSQLLALAAAEGAVSRQIARVEGVAQRLDDEREGLRREMRALEGAEEWRAPNAAKVQEWARTSRHLRNKVEDYRERLGEGGEGGSGRGRKRVDVPMLVRMETEVAALKERVLDMEAQARGYQGLPPEKDLARVEVERVQAELGELERRREALYDGMVA